MPKYSFPYPSLDGNFGHIEIDAESADEARKRAEKMISDGTVTDYNPKFTEELWRDTLLGRHHGEPWRLSLDGIEKIEEVEKIEFLKHNEEAPEWTLYIFKSIPRWKGGKDTFVFRREIRHGMGAAASEKMQKKVLVTLANEWLREYDLAPIESVESIGVAT